MLSSGNVRCYFDSNDYIIVHENSSLESILYMLALVKSTFSISPIIQWQSEQSEHGGLIINT